MRIAKFKVYIEILCKGTHKANPASMGVSTIDSSIQHFKELELKQIQF